MEEVERPHRRIRRLRLIQLLREEGGPRALQLISGVTDTHLTACEKGRRNVGDEMATKLEAATGRAFGWMDVDPSTAEAGSWPFPKIERSRFDALDADEKTEIQGVVRDRIESFERARAANRAAA